MAEYGREVQEAASQAFKSPAALTSSRLGRHVAAGASSVSSSSSRSMATSRRSASVITSQDEAELFDQMSQATSVKVGGKRKKNRVAEISASRSVEAAANLILQSFSMGSNEGRPPTGHNSLDHGAVSPASSHFSDDYNSTENYFSPGGALSIDSPGRVEEKVMQRNRQAKQQRPELDVPTLDEKKTSEAGDEQVVVPRTVNRQDYATLPVDRPEASVAAAAPANPPQVAPQVEESATALLQKTEVEAPPLVDKDPSPVEQDVAADETLDAPDDEFFKRAAADPNVPHLGVVDDSQISPSAEEDARKQLGVLQQPKEVEEGSKMVEAEEIQSHMEVDTTAEAALLKKEPVAVETVESGTFVVLARMSTNLYRPERIANELPLPSSDDDAEGPMTILEKSTSKQEDVVPTVNLRSSEGQPAVLQKQNSFDRIIAGSFDRIIAGTSPGENTPSNDRSVSFEEPGSNVAASRPSEGPAVDLLGVNALQPADTAAIRSQVLSEPRLEPQFDFLDSNPARLVDRSAVADQQMTRESQHTFADPYADTSRAFHSLGMDGFTRAGGSGNVDYERESLFSVGSDPDQQERISRMVASLSTTLTNNDAEKPQGLAESNEEELVPLAPNPQGVSESDEEELAQIAPVDSSECESVVDLKVDDYNFHLVAHKAMTFLHSRIGEDKNSLTLLPRDRDMIDGVLPGEERFRFLDALRYRLSVTTTEPTNELDFLILRCQELGLNAEAEKNPIIAAFVMGGQPLTLAVVNGLDIKKAPATDPCWFDDDESSEPEMPSVSAEDAATQMSGLTGLEDGTEDAHGENFPSQQAPVSDSQQAPVSNEAETKPTRSDSFGAFASMVSGFQDAFLSAVDPTPESVVDSRSVEVTKREASVVGDREQLASEGGSVSLPTPDTPNTGATPKRDDRSVTPQNPFAPSGGPPSFGSGQSQQLDISALDGSVSDGDLKNEKATRHRLQAEIREASKLVVTSENPETAAFWRNHVVGLQRKLEALQKSVSAANTQQSANDNTGGLPRDFLSGPLANEGDYQAMEDPPLGKDTDPSKMQPMEYDSRMVDVIAPADLPGGYHFEAEIEGQRFLATVPDGGVQQGETFTCYMRELNSVAIDIPVGYWKDGMCNMCTHGLCHPTLWHGLFCPLGKTTFP
jgi:hypothetical protein